MESTETEARRQRLSEKAVKSNRKSSRYLKKVQREIQKGNSDITKMINWQKKSSKYLKRALRYMKERQTLHDRGSKTEIFFKIEKVEAKY